MAKLAAESVLIVFSVLFALLLNEYRGRLKDDRVRKQALSRVTNEIQTNLGTVEGWLPYHRVVLENLKAAVTSDSIQNSLQTDAGIQYRTLMPRGVVQRVISRASWQAFNSSGAMASTEFDTLLPLSNLYSVQEIGVETTLKIILEILISREAFKPEELKATLQLLRRAFGELVAQEVFLIESYKAVLVQLNPDST